MVIIPVMISTDNQLEPRLKTICTTM